MKPGNDDQIKPQEIVVVSGKGGTGKTTITSSLAELLPGVMMADADVEAANWHLLLEPRNVRGTDFTGKSIAKIDEEKCTGCGRCAELCRFDALQTVAAGERSVYQVDPVGCDGCRLCQLACPAQAVEMEPQIVGQWFRADTGSGPLVYARLKPGGENSGHLVAMVKKQARLVAEEAGKKIVIVDGPPGIGCPVIAALSGARFAVVVTEPTFSGLSDLERVLRLIRHFKVPCGVVVNRFDINPGNCKKIDALLVRENVPLLARVPHSFQIMEEISRGHLPVRRSTELQEAVGHIRAYLEKKEIISIGE